MTDGDLTRLHDATIRAMNVRNYLRREVAKLEGTLDTRRAELQQAETVFGQLQAKCEEEATPKMPEVK
jgi:hypothetical protein